MGMGRYGVTLVVLEPQELEKLELKSYENLNIVLEKWGVEWETFSNYLNIDLDLFDKDYPEGAQEEIEEAHTKFITEFKEKTGIDILVNFHDLEENGDRYDEVDGLYFELDFQDTYQLTDKAKKLSEKVFFELKTYTLYG